MMIPKKIFQFRHGNSIHAKLLRSKKGEGIILSPIKGYSNPIGASGWSPPASLEAQWTMNNDSTDNSGNSRDLTNVDGTYDATIKKLGSHSWKGNNTSAYLYITDPAWMDTLLGQSFTVEGWFRLNSTNSDEDIFGKAQTDGEGAVGFKMWFAYFSNRLRARLKQNASNIHDVNTTGWAASANTWYHVAVVRDISQGANQQLKIYIDGVDKTNIISTTGNPQDVSNAKDLVIGTNPGKNKFFNGYFDCVRVWNDVRTQSEISNNKDTEEPS